MCFIGEMRCCVKAVILLSYYEANLQLLDISIVLAYVVLLVNIHCNYKYPNMLTCIVHSA